MTIDQLLNDEQAAEMLGLSRSYMRKMRLSGGGPRYAKLAERAVRYRVSDLQAWVASKVVGSTTEN